MYTSQSRLTTDESLKGFAVLIYRINTIGFYMNCFNRFTGDWDEDPVDYTYALYVQYPLYHLI